MKTPQIVFALFLLIILVSTGSHAQSVYYVSHSTSLKEDGSQAYPYHSIHRAIEKAKEDKNSVTIYLREGKYILDKPIVLTPENSCDSKTLTIKAYPEENVVLSSGISLNLKWEKYKKGIMRASVSGNPIMDMLIVNGNIRHMARFPNYDKEAVRKVVGKTIVQWESIKRIGWWKTSLKNWMLPENGIIAKMKVGCIIILYQRRTLMRRPLKLRNLNI